MIVSGQVEKAAGGFGDGGGEGVERHTSKFGKEAGGVDEQGWLVHFLLSHWFGGHIRTVGLEHQAVEGDDFGCVAGLFSVFEGDDTGERDVPSPVEEDFGLFGRAGETVEDDLRQSGLEFIHDCEGFVECFSGVDDEGQVEVGGEFEVAGEDVLLGRPF